MTIITSFSDAFVLTCGLEGSGNLSKDPNDSGNWTGGKVGAGKLVGSKFGISAAAFPALDISNLTYAQAQTLAKIRYWDPFQCDQFPPVVAWLVFDSAYNGGHPVQWLQQAVGAAVDGNVGAQTVAAVRSFPLATLALRFLANRMDYWTSLDAWTTQGRGWARRENSILRIVSDNL